MNRRPLVLIVAAALALSWSPIPDFPDDRVAVAVAPGSFETLRAFLAEFNSAVDADYQVAVVENSDSADRVGPEWGDDSGAYADAFAAAWGPSYNLSRGVLVILALQNREVIVQPGSDWIALGWEDAHVSATIDSSEFANHARAGDYSGALETLIHQVDNELERRQNALATAQTNAAERIAQAEQFHAFVVTQHLLHEEITTTRIDELMAQGLARTEEASDEFARGNLDLSIHIANDAMRQVEIAYGDFNSLRSARRFKRVTLLSMLSVFFALGLFIATLYRTRSRRSLNAIASARLQEWQTCLGHATANLIEIEERHPVLLGRDDLNSWFTGESEAPVKEIARRVDDLFLAYEVCTDLVSEAKTLIDECGFPRTRGYQLAINKLGADEVVARTEDVKKRRLFLPEKREIRMPAAELLHLMDRNYGALVSEIERIVNDFTTVWDAIDSLEPRLVEVTEAQDALHDRELWIAALDERLERATNQFQTLRGNAQRDPLASVDRTKALSERIDGLDDEFDVAAGAWVELVDTSKPALEALTLRVAAMRADEGYLLVEPGFETDILLADGRAAHDTAVEAFNEALIELGDAAASDLADAVAELEALLDDVELARAEGGVWIDDVRGRAEALRGQLPAQTERIESLRDLHADEALQPALDNAEEAAATLTFAREAADEASTAFHAQVQRYLAGTELVERARDALDAVEALYAEVEAKADELARAQTQAEERGTDLTGVVNELSAALGSPAPFATAVTLKAFADLERFAQTQAEACFHKRPNWLLCAANAAELLTVGSFLEARIEEERADFEASKALLAEANRLQATTGTVLEGSEDDRVIANQRFTEGVEALTNANRASEDERPVWASIRSSLQRAVVEFKAAAAAAHADIDAAHSARTEIANARAAISTARHHSPAGRPAALGTADAAFEQAEAALVLDDYADARRSATTARTDANNALRAAQEAHREACDQQWTASEQTALRAPLFLSRFASFGPRGLLATYAELWRAVRTTSVTTWGDSSHRSSAPSWGSTRRSSSRFGGSRRSPSFGSSRSTSFSKPSSRRSSSRSSFKRASGRSSFKKASGRGKF